MIEFFKSIYQWLAENKDEIVVTLTTFATSGTAINLWQWFKNRATITSNTESNNSLVETVKNVVAENSNLTNIIDKAKEAVKTVQEKVELLENKIIDTVNGVDTVITKVNAMLDVQSLVYQTIRDDSTRTAVQNILTNAKYAATEQRAKLIEQLNELKANVAEQAKQSQAQVEAAVNSAVSLVEAARTETNTVIRG